MSSPVGPAFADLSCATPGGCRCALEPSAGGKSYEIPISKLISSQFYINANQMGGHKTVMQIAL